MRNKMRGIGLAMVLLGAAGMGAVGVGGQMHANEHAQKVEAAGGEQAYNDSIPAINRGENFDQWLGSDGI